MRHPRNHYLLVALVAAVAAITTTTAPPQPLCRSDLTCPHLRQRLTMSPHYRLLLLQHLRPNTLTIGLVKSSKK
jgi:hypothetical protein